MNCYRRKNIFCGKPDLNMNFTKHNFLEQIPNMGKITKHATCHVNMNNNINSDSLTLTAPVKQSETVLEKF